MGLYSAGEITKTYTLYLVFGFYRGGYENLHSAEEITKTYTLTKPGFS